MADVDWDTGLGQVETAGRLRRIGEGKTWFKVPGYPVLDLAVEIDP